MYDYGMVVVLLGTGSNGAGGAANKLRARLRARDQAGLQQLAADLLPLRKYGFGFLYELGGTASRLTEDGTHVDHCRDTVGNLPADPPHQRLHPMVFFIMAGNYPDLDGARLSGYSGAPGR